MPTAQDLENARAALATALGEVQRYGQEALDALRVGDLVGSPSSQRLFKEKAKRAMLASDNWRRAADVALSVIAEIEAGVPLKR